MEREMPEGEVKLERGKEVGRNEGVLWGFIPVQDVPMWRNLTLSVSPPLFLSISQSSEEIKILLVFSLNESW